MLAPVGDVGEVGDMMESEPPVTVLAVDEESGLFIWGGVESGEDWDTERRSAWKRYLL